MQKCILWYEYLYVCIHVFVYVHVHLHVHIGTWLSLKGFIEYHNFGIILLF